jgi:hypothetical protein
MAGVVLVIAAPVAVATPAKTAATTKCPKMPGKPWKINGKSGNLYTTIGLGVTCAFIKPWVAKITVQRGVLKGPAGWRCYPQATSGGFRCDTTSGARKSFAAQPDFLS